MWFLQAYINLYQVHIEVYMFECHEGFFHVAIPGTNLKLPQNFTELLRLFKGAYKSTYFGAQEVKPTIKAE